MLGELAGDFGLCISFECHGHTLTDSRESAISLMGSVGGRNVRMHWQPYPGLPTSDCTDCLRSILPWLGHLHVWHWSVRTHDRLPLSEGETEWTSYLNIARSAGGERFALLEFVRDDDPSRFSEDAATIRGWLR